MEFFIVLFNTLFFSLERCVNVSKIFLPSFKAVRPFWRDFFPKEWRTTTIEGRLSSSLHQYSSSIYRVVTMEYRRSTCSVRGSACISSEYALRELSVAVVRPALIFHCASWASNFCAWPCRRHPTFLLKRRSNCSNRHSVTWSFLFEASRLSTRCGKVRVQSQHRRSS